MLSKQVKPQYVEMSSDALKCNDRSANGGLGRALFVSVALLVGTSLAGCADQNSAANAKMADASPWKAAGGNDGKTNRYVVGQLNSTQSAQTDQLAQTATSGH
jgi:Spy/CpxP family protein refolding chaperone